jgi:hypothetical protein
MADLAQGESSWYVISRDGSLRAFDVAGASIWGWRFPESVDDSHCCGSYVSYHSRLVIAGSSEAVYALSPAGRLLWKLDLPDRRQSRRHIKVPGVASTLLRRLAQGALPLVESKSAESMAACRVRLAFNTDVTNCFGSEGSLKLVSERYLEVSAPELELDLQIGSSPWSEHLVHVRALADMILVGTSQGRVHFLSRGGEFLASHVVGSAPICESSSDSNGVVAVYCAGTLR